MLEEILDIRNVQKAFKQVTANKGAGGIDGMQTDELRDYLNASWQTLRKAILEGNYQPQPVRVVEIPKPQGGTRMLGIPFRPGRNAHQAFLQAQSYLNEGYEYITELDLEKFFDKVKHDKLMGLLAKQIADKRTLKLIRSYLTRGIMEGGVASPRTEGTPQSLPRTCFGGSPLSPLLSNIILHELLKTEHQTKLF